MFYQNTQTKDSVPCANSAQHHFVPYRTAANSSSARIRALAAASSFVPLTRM